MKLETNWQKRVKTFNFLDDKEIHYRLKKKIFTKATRKFIQKNTKYALHYEFQETIFNETKIITHLTITMNLVEISEILK